MGVLAILNRLYHVDADTLGWWLCERQLPSGGLNGNAVMYDIIVWSTSIAVGAYDAAVKFGVQYTDILGYRSLPQPFYGPFFGTIHASWCQK